MIVEKKKKNIVQILGKDCRKISLTVVEKKNSSYPDLMKTETKL